MKNSMFLVASMAAVTLLSACNSAPSAINTPPSSTPTAAQLSRDANDGQRAGMMQHQQDLQQYLDEANAASDKTEITKDQFSADVQTLMQAQRTEAQQSNNASNRPARSFSGGMLRQSRTGSGRMMAVMATATKFLKYTDPTGNEVLLALDANGKVISKWPRAFGGGRGGPNGMMRTQDNSGTQVSGNAASDTTAPVVNNQ